MISGRSLPSVDETYLSTISRLPDELREYARPLAWRIGLTREPQGGWEDFWILDPNRHPARYLETFGQDQLDRIDAAHHIAVFFGLVFDRLADRQVARDPRLLACREFFLRAWISSLAEVLGDMPSARRVVARALRSLLAGTRSERCVWSSRQLDAVTYARQTREKLRWCSATPVAVIDARDAARAALFERCYDLFGMAVQCTDDAVDGEEDVATVGCSAPVLLGVSDEALIVAARHLIESATRDANAGGFHALAAWLERFRGFLVNTSRRVGGDGVRHEREGAALSSALEEILCATSTRDTTAISI